MPWMSTLLPMEPHLSDTVLHLRRRHYPQDKVSCIGVPNSRLSYPSTVLHLLASSEHLPCGAPKGSFIHVPCGSQGPSYSLSVREIFSCFQIISLHFNARVTVVVCCEFLFVFSVIFIENNFSEDIVWSWFPLPQLLPACLLTHLPTLFFYF